MAQHVSLTAKQVAALESLASGATRTAAAVAAGVSRRTVARWLSDVVFVAELRALESEALLRLARQLAGLSSAAVEAISSALAEEQPIGIRLRAAAIVVGVVPDLAELANILPRLEQLERQYGNGHRTAA